MVLKVIMLVVFFAIMLGVGFYSRKHTKDVNGFVLGGRSVGPWLTAFAYGTSVWMEVRNCFHMDRNWKCAAWLTGGMGSSRKKNKTAHTGA